MYRKIIYEKYLSSMNIFKKDLDSRLKENLRLQKEMINALPANINARILNLGCGYGVFLNDFKKKGYHEIYGVEVDNEESAYLNSIDFVVLEHFTKNEIVEILPLLYENLHVNGKLMIRLPNGEAILKGSIVYGDFTHETYLTKRSMVQLFNAFGFSDVQVYPTFNFGKIWKEKITKFIYLSYVRLYKMLLKIDNSASAEYFIPTQNILGIIKK